MSQDILKLRMDHIFEHCPGMITSTDDVVVFGRMEDEHDKNLINLMKVSEEHGLTFNSAKFKIKVNSLPFFSESYSSHGIRPDPERVVAIEALPAPIHKE